jgi:hypothetical protein
MTNRTKINKKSDEPQKFDFFDTGVLSHLISAKIVDYLLKKTEEMVVSNGLKQIL